jgi:[ribosomal protein S5]-alanine N-acetyltransferase
MRAMTVGWECGLPTLKGERITLRELRLTDAPALCQRLGAEEVARFISPPPTTVDDFERFIAWTQRQRQAGASACFAVTYRGSAPIGIFQVRDLSSGFDTAEWGFALGAAYWGTGIFEEAAALVLAFTFETLRVTRLEARAAAANGRGNGALRKIGAVHEARLRQAFRKDGVVFDEFLWTILRDDWYRRELTAPAPRLDDVGIHVANG